MKTIKTFPKSNLKLKEWFVWENDKNNIVGTLYTNKIILVHKTQLKRRPTQEKFKPIPVLSLDIEILKTIINNQAQILTQINFNNVPPPYPNFNDVKNSYTLKIKTINNLTF